MTYSQALFFFLQMERKDWEGIQISTVVCNPAWELSVEKGWGQMCSVFLRTRKHVHLQPVVAGDRELTPFVVTCSICQ